jgi:hypothetical protein
MNKILGPPKLKRKKSTQFECMLNLPIGCMKYLFPKLFVTIIGLGILILYLMSFISQP